MNKKWLYGAAIGLGLLVLAPTYTYVRKEVANTWSAVQTFASGLTISSGAFKRSGLQVKEVCSNGCEFTTLNTACATYTSTASAPIQFHIHAGVYAAADTMCSGQDHASFVGDGAGVTVLQGLDHGFGSDLTHTDCATFPKACKGALNLGTSTNIEVSDMTLRGSRGINWLANSTGGGTSYLHNLELITNTTNLDEDCFFMSNGSNPVTLTYRGNFCYTTADGFTVNETDGLTVHGSSNYFGMSGSPSLLMGFWSFRAIPCSFDSVGDKFEYSGAHGSASGIHAYDLDGSSTVSCSTAGKAQIIAPNISIINTDANGGQIDAEGIGIAATATELGQLDIISPNIRVSTTDTTTGQAYGILQKTNTATVTNVIGGNILASGGLAATTYDIAATPSNGTIFINIVGVNSLGAIHPATSVAALDQKYLKATVAASLPASTTITRASGAGTPTIATTGGTLESGLLLDNTNTGGSETSPILTFSNGTTANDAYSMYVDGSTTPANFILAAGSTTRVNVDENRFQYTGAANGGIYNNNAGASIHLGDGSANDNMEIKYEGTNPLSLGWTASTKTLNMTGLERLKLGAGSDLAVGACTVGVIAYDTGGATAELCFCFSSNVWGCWKPDGTFTANGPAD